MLARCGVAVASLFKRQTKTNSKHENIASYSGKRSINNKTYYERHGRSLLQLNRFLNITFSLFGTDLNI